MDLAFALSDHLSAGWTQKTPKSQQRIECMMGRSWHSESHVEGLPPVCTSYFGPCVSKLVMHIALDIIWIFELVHYSS